MKNKFLLLFGFLVILFVACKKNETTPELLTLDTTPFNLAVSSTLPAPNIPSDNPLTVQKVQLGRMLFYEKLLSGNNTISCASCHTQVNGFSDLNQFSTGIDGLFGARHAMGIFNLGLNTNGFFWDGRVNTLREQSLRPIQDPLEMHETLQNAVNKLQNDERYRKQFVRAFGDAVVTAERISLALEQFMLTIVSDNSKYDQYLRGEINLTESEERGRVLFFAEYNPGFPNSSGADCAHCHSGSNFENDQFMNNGLDQEGDISDLGRQNVTQSPADKGKFKVTSLRNIEVTAPYMHDGRFTTLEQVVNHYSDNIQQSASLDPALANTMATGLMLTTQDKIDLVNFLKTLTDQTYLTNPAYKNPF
ncbi:cytochrome-c peroxidase [Fluviicola taffensis]|uniref:Cytochrome-c peroxidase n=1 Tax=Fluviicola taffensis (strain DSM 16823 / NCIMB 13979 / RW262) TaxID=755732 RepID=F2IIP4_FLUTR|nr:cytochrome c peroxidase [Fluviicola taffensis]AEA46006.1 Cytochrome-c peroxidase [Fluviicola taffensis DSM 16823]